MAGVPGVCAPGGALVWTARSNMHRGHNPPVALVVTLAPQVGQSWSETDITIVPSIKRAASFVLVPGILGSRLALQLLTAVPLSPQFKGSRPHPHNTANKCRNSSSTSAGLATVLAISARINSP